MLLGLDWRHTTVNVVAWCSLTETYVPGLDWRHTAVNVVACRSLTETCVPEYVCVCYIDNMLENYFYGFIYHLKNMFVVPQIDERWGRHYERLHVR